MPLTAHQRRHLNAVIADADDLRPTERARVIREATDILNEVAPWPGIRNTLSVHDWVEKPAERPGLEDPTR